jgi:hypothetical protein
MCVEADGRDTDRQLHISGGLAYDKRCQVGAGMQLFGMLRATVSPLRSPPGVAGGQLAKRLCAVQSWPCLEGDGPGSGGEAGGVAAVCRS